MGAHLPNGGKVARKDKGQIQGYQHFLIQVDLKVNLLYLFQEQAAYVSEGPTENETVALQKGRRGVRFRMGRRSDLVDDIGAPV